MKVAFKTNIDAYKMGCFPDNITQAPCKGDKVYVTEAFLLYFDQKKLPIRLEVVSVSWTEHGVICDLWYNDTDKKLADNAGAKTL